ncbi:unnamed protein product [Protopolystoma xenopodis]|uniref:Uncharacterized protein n=1 Tax=Protopolystoma xenopodis TaxID=117903 RepID=A0A3S5CBL6_9PLAT|nr:unnamed protein product [Protopolystoma xenopodis]
MLSLIFHSLSHTHLLRSRPTCIQGLHQFECIYRHILAFIVRPTDSSAGPVDPNCYLRSAIHLQQVLLSVSYSNASELPFIVKQVNPHL